MKTIKNLRNQAVLTIVNEAIGETIIPKVQRSHLMKLLYKGVREGDVNYFSGIVSHSKNGVKQQDRWMIKINTSITPYVFKGGKSPAVNADNLVKGVCLKRYVEALAEMFDKGQIDPFVGITEEQYLKITKVSIRTFTRSNGVVITAPVK